MRGNTNRKLATTVVVIDPHPLRQQRSKALLQRHGLDVVAVTGAVEHAPEIAEAHSCEAMFIVLAEGIDAGTVYSLLRKTHKRRPSLVTVAMVDDDDPARVEAALAAGTFAVVPTSTSAQELARLAVDAVTAQRSADEQDDQASRCRLTRREIEILRLVAEGRSNREVAKLLWVTDQTVKFHLANTYRKLGVRNRVEASQWAFTRGLVRPELHLGARAHMAGPFAAGARAQADAVAVTP